MAVIEERLAAVLTAPLDTLLSPDDWAPLEESVVGRWDLPEPDRVALVHRGLPPDGILGSEAQQDHEPRLRSDGRTLYDLGTWGAAREEQPRVGASAGDGRVFLVSPRPLTVDDLHPAVRELHAGFHRPALLPLNSSVAQLVEVMWRVRAALDILLALQEPAWDASPEAHEAHGNRLLACRRLILTHLAAVDPAVRADDPDTLWLEAITD